jgi:hypothetical protein
MLPRSHEHVLSRCYVYNGRFSGVGVGHPYRDGEAIYRAAKGYGEGSAEEEQQRRCSVFVC